MCGAFTDSDGVWLFFRSWRVDVTLSTSASYKVLKPAVLFRVVLDDGTTHVFEASVQELHTFRHALATALYKLDRTSTIAEQALATLESSRVAQSASR